MEQARGGWTLPRDCGGGIVRKLRGAGCGDQHRPQGALAAGASRGGGGGLRAACESRDDSGTGGRRHHLWIDGGAEGRNHDREWAGGASELQRLRYGADERSTAGGSAHRGEQRRARRYRGAGGAAYRSGSVQRDLCGDGETGATAADPRGRVEVGDRVAAAWAVRTNRGGNSFTSYSTMFF